MSEEIVRISSISQLHQMTGLSKPTHPLISVVDVSQWDVNPQWMGVKFAIDLYSIALKDTSCAMDYGRNSYDFNEGVLIFTGPNQVITAQKQQEPKEVSGWVLFFHPDLIRNTPLGKSIDNYQFFSYDVHEALHLSDAEQHTLTECKNMIEGEIKARIDNHSQRVIVSTLELLLNYSLRYYERQFHTRAAQNKDVVSHFNQLLKEYYEAGRFTELGAPSADYFAGHIHLSPNYLSDLMKKETGYSIKDIISNFIVDKAKTMLLSENDSISGIAYKLGFNYPHYFSRLFKARTGLTPHEYRSETNNP